MKDILAYSDINLDFLPHPLTGNLNPKINIESIRQSIKVLFMLNPYEIPFNSSDFINLRKYLFEKLNNITIASLVKRIEWCIGTYEKRVVLLSVKVNVYDSEDGFDITVTYKIKALNIDDTLTQQFQRVR